MPLSYEGCTDVTGKTIVISTAASDECERRIQDPATPPEERQQAIDLLAWLADACAKVAGQSPLEFEAELRKPVQSVKGKTRKADTVVPIGMA